MSWLLWFILIIPALGSLRQKNHLEFQASLKFQASSQIIIFLLVIIITREVQASLGAGVEPDLRGFFGRGGIREDVSAGTPCAHADPGRAGAHL